MADIEAASVPVLAVTAAVGAVVLLLMLVCGIGRKEDKDQKKNEKETEENGHAVKEKPQQTSKKTKPLRAPKNVKTAFTHPWLASSLKGHSSPVLDMDFSQNAKYLVTCAEDRTVLMWYTKEFNEKNKKFVRGNVELDHATRIKFSPDSKAFVINIFRDNTIRILKIGKKPDGSPGNIQPAFDFPKLHKDDIINIGIASSGKFIMTASKDTIIKIWDLKGEILATIDTHQVNNSFAMVSPCGRFVASSGFTPDVKVWEVGFDKSGNFTAVSRAFELKGHTAGIYSFAFSGDSHYMASVSKDGTWRTFDTNIEYQKGQDPYLLKTGKYAHNGPSLIALSPDARTVAIGCGTSVSIFNASTTECEVIEDCHTAPVTCMSFDPTSRYLLTSGDKHVHVFHNVIGYRATIVDLEEKRKKATSQPLRDRLLEQIQEAKDALDKIKSKEEE